MIKKIVSLGLSLLTLTVTAGAAFLFVDGGTVESRDPKDCMQLDGKAIPCVVDFGLPTRFNDPAGAGGGVTRDRNDPTIIYAALKDGEVTLRFDNSGGQHRLLLYNHGLGSDGRTTFIDVDNTSTGRVVGNIIQAEAGKTIFGPTDNTAASHFYTFTEPGQYLLICAFNPHWNNFSQHTYIIVHEGANYEYN